MKTRIFAFVPVLIWMGVIFFFSSRMRVSVSSEYVLNFIFFKTLHILEYAVLFALSYRAFCTTVSGRSATLNAFIYAFLLSVVYAASDEIHQMFVQTREGTVRDVIIDALGALSAWMVIASLRPKLPPELKKWLRS